MTTDKKEEKVKSVLLKLIKIVSISVGSILGIFLLLLLLAWANFLPTNPPSQYKTPVVYQGRTDMKVDCYNGSKCTPERMAWKYLYNSMVPCRVDHKGKTFLLEVSEIEHKEEALRILQHGIDRGLVYADDQNYLVTE